MKKNNEQLKEQLKLNKIKCTELENEVKNLQLGQRKEVKSQ